jgi:hypothetical protein
MGYRSDVAYVIKFDDIQTRDAYVTLMLANEDKLVREAIEECDYDNPRDPIITFRADDVKWYPDYGDGKSHTYIYQTAHELEMGSYRFIALGEDGTETFDADEIHDGHDLYDYITTRHVLDTNF